MSQPHTDPKFAHPVRGIVVAAVLGPLMMIFGLNAAVALLDQFVSGFIPSRWFSDNALDWATSFGTVGGAANYFTILVNGLLGYGCYSVIVWAFTGKGPDSSS